MKSNTTCFDKEKSQRKTRTTVFDHVNTKEKSVFVKRAECQKRMISGFSDLDSHLLPLNFD